jgi:AraC-like DNA-binding protein
MITCMLDNPEGPVFVTENDQVRFGSFHHVDVRADSPMKSLSLQNLYLPSLTVKKFDGVFSQDVRLVNTNNVGSDLVGFCFFLKGNLTTHLPRAARSVKIVDGDQKLKFDPNSEMTHIATGNQQLQFIHISVEPRYFFSLLPENESWSDQLQNDIHKGKMIFKESPAALSLIQQVAIQNIVRSPYQGKLGMLMLESSVTQAIVSLIQQTFQPEGRASAKLSPRDRDVMHDIRSFLLQNFLNSHSLACLSRHFGINQTKMVSGFKAEFGTSIFEYIGGLKLAHAKRLIEEEGMFVQEVSSIIGYKNPNHFSVAFKKKFGVSPSALKC